MIKKKKNPVIKVANQVPRKRSSKASSESEGAVGPELQNKRVNLGLTQKDLSEMCNLQIATIAKIEKGNPGVKLGTLQVYLDALNLKLTIQEKELE